MKTLFKLIVLCALSVGLILPAWAGEEQPVPVDPKNINLDGTMLCFLEKDDTGATFQSMGSEQEIRLTTEILGGALATESLNLTRGTCYAVLTEKGTGKIEKFLPTFRLKERVLGEDMANLENFEVAPEAKCSHPNPLARQGNVNPENISDICDEKGPVFCGCGMKLEHPALPGFAHPMMLIGHTYYVSEEECEDWIKSHPPQLNSGWWESWIKLYWPAWYIYMINHLPDQSSTSNNEGH